jgi:hypothetical protein
MTMPKPKIPSTNGIWRCGIYYCPRHRRRRRRSQHHPCIIINPFVWMSSMLPLPWIMSITYTHVRCVVPIIGILFLQAVMEINVGVYNTTDAYNNDNEDENGQRQ